MTEEDKRNERRKYAAGLVNGLAGAVIGAGTFAPAAQAIFNLMPATTETLTLYGFGLSCVGIGVVLHLTGQLILGALE
jgi:hypothetical protein